MNNPKSKFARRYSFSEYGHVERNEKMGVGFSSGRLGPLWSMVDGVALAHPDKSVLMSGSDGSQMEGEDAEAARFAVAHRLKVILLIDDNDITCAGNPSEFMPGFDVAKTLEGHGLATMARLNEVNLLCRFTHCGVDMIPDNTCHYGMNVFFADNGLLGQNPTPLYFPADPLQMEAVVKWVFHDHGIRFVFCTRPAVPYILDEAGNKFFEPARYTFQRRMQKTEVRGQKLLPALSTDRNLERLIPNSGLS